MLFSALFYFQIFQNWWDIATNHKKISGSRKTILLLFWDDYDYTGKVLEKIPWNNEC